MIALAGWGWALIGILIFLGVGLAGALLLGALGLGGDLARRLAHAVGARRRIYRGVELPDEVPEAPPRDEPDEPSR